MLVQVEYVFWGMYAGEGQTRQFSVPNTGHFHYQSRTFAGWTHSGRDDQHFHCDVTDDDVFMRCRMFISNQERPCAEGVFVRSEGGEVRGAGGSVNVLDDVLNMLRQ